MQYLLLIYDEPGAYDSLGPEDRQALYAEYARLSADLVERGAFAGANPLEPVSTARTVRMRDGERLVTDGPSGPSSRPRPCRIPRTGLATRG